MIAFAPGDRVLVEDDHVLYTGQIVDMFLVVHHEARIPAELGYAVALDGDGAPVLLAYHGGIWPEGATLPPPDPDAEDGSHEWPHGMGVAP